MTGMTPAEAFLRRKPTVFLHTLRHTPSDHQDRRRFKMKMNFDKNRSVHTFEPEEPIRYRQLVDQQWKPGTIVQQNGPLSYTAQSNDGREVIRVHVDHLIRNRRTPARLEDYVL